MGKQNGTDLSFITEKAEAAGFTSDTTATQSDPYFNLLQDTSEACKPGNPAYIQGAEAGKWLYTRGNILLTTFDVSVLSFEEVYSEFQKQGVGGFMGYHTPPQAMKKAIEQDGFDYITREGTKLTRTYAYLLYCHDRDEYGFYVARSTALGVCKRWNSTRHMQKNELQKQLPDGIVAQNYHLVWEVGSVLAQGNGNSYFKPYFKFNGVVDKEQYEKVRAVKEEVDQMQYSIMQNPVFIESDNTPVAPKGLPRL